MKTARLSFPKRLAVLAQTYSPDECWPWPLATNQGGYGRARVGDRSQEAHRAVYEAIRGPVPDGLVLDHTCHNDDPLCLGGPTCPHRRCVNPAHLRAVTNAENIRSGRGPAMLNDRVLSATKCRNGHDYTPENTTTRGGWRQCRRCATLRQRRYVDRTREIAEAPRSANRGGPQRLRHGGASSNARRESS